MKLTIMIDRIVIAPETDLENDLIRKWGNGTAKIGASSLQVQGGQKNYAVCVLFEDKDSIESLRKERDDYAEAGLLALSGIIPTPEKGYVQDGGPQLMKSDLLRLRSMVEQSGAV